MATETVEGVELDVPQKSQKGPWIAVIVVALLCNVAWGGVFFMTKNSSAAVGPEHEAAAAESSDAAEDPDSEEAGMVGDEPGPLVTLDPFVVNLNDPANTRYLRIGISLEIGSEKERDLVDKRLVPLRDEFIRHLSSQEPAQLLSRNDKDKLREALLHKAQTVVPKKAVRQIYFTEFMMQ